MTIDQILSRLNCNVFDWDCVELELKTTGFTYDDWEQWVRRNS